MDIKVIDKLNLRNELLMQLHVWCAYHIRNSMQKHEHIKFSYIDGLTYIYKHKPCFNIYILISKIPY